MSQFLKKLHILSLFIVVSIVVFGCGKSKTNWLYYDETYCADKWEHTMNNEKLKDNIVSHLDKKGIKVLEIEIFSDRVAESCTDCSCKSGRRIKCKVKKRDVGPIKSAGFYE